MLDFYVIYFFQITLESLPVSSSGHLKLLSCIFHQHIISEQYEFLLHLPTLMIVILFYRKKIMSIAKDMSYYLPMLTLIGIADLITVLFYFTLRPMLQQINVTIGFILTGCILLSGIVLNQYRFSIRPPWLQGIILGIVQGCAFAPGISRLGFTIRAAQFMGFSDRDAFLVSWLCMLPLMCAAVTKGLVTVQIPPLDPCLLAIISVATGVGYYLMGISYNLTVRHTLWKLSIYMFLISFISFFVVNWCT